MRRTLFHPSQARCTSQSESQARKTQAYSMFDGNSEAERRLAALKAAREASDRVVSWKSQPTQRSNLSKYLDVKEDPDIGAAPRQVDIRMYDALQASRNRLSVALNTTRKKTEMLEDIVAEKDDALVEAFDCLTRALSEYKNLQKLSQGAAAGVQFGVSQDDALRKLLIMQERIEFMHERIAESRAELSKHVIRAVPVVWSGLASEVRLKGDFDHWGEGFLLSSDCIDDHIFKRFKADVALLPGTYRVKFSVDGEWRLAPDWPTEDTSTGDTNNLLVVEPEL